MDADLLVWDEDDLAQVDPATHCRTGGSTLERDMLCNWVCPWCNRERTPVVTLCGPMAAGASGVGPDGHPDPGLVVAPDPAGEGPLLDRAGGGRGSLAVQDGVERRSHYVAFE